MTKPVKVFEAYKNSQGRYECHSVRETAFEQDHSGSDYCDSDHSNPSPGVAGNAFFIDPNLAKVVPPDWALQAREIFLQSLHSNCHGGHAEYLKQMHVQFELMRQTLQQQMAQFSQKN